MKTCVFAGTFDPFSKGHKAVVDKLLRANKRVIITVGNNPRKTPFFSAGERAEMIKAVYRGEKRVKVVVFDGDTAAYKKTLTAAGATEYYRGIRNAADYEYERKAEDFNNAEYPFIKTEYVYVKKYGRVSSSLIKERLACGKDVKKFIPKKAYPIFRKFLKEKRKG